MRIRSEICVTVARPQPAEEAIQAIRSGGKYPSRFGPATRFVHEFHDVALEVCIDRIPVHPSGTPDPGIRVQRYVETIRSMMNGRSGAGSRWTWARAPNGQRRFPATAPETRRSDQAPRRRSHPRISLCLPRSLRNRCGLMSGRRGVSRLPGDAVHRAGATNRIPAFPGEPTRLPSSDREDSREGARRDIDDQTSAPGLRRWDVNWPPVILAFCAKRGENMPVSAVAVQALRDKCARRT